MGDIHKENKVNVERTIRPYDEFFNLTYYSFKQAEDQEKLRFYNCMVTMVFCAFSIEAFLNHLGEEMIPDWETIEKKKDINEKLKILSNSRNVTIDKRKEPFCYLNMIFDYRKDIVHGKTQTFNERQSMNQNGIPSMPAAKWEKMTTLEKAKKFRKYTKEIIISLSTDICENEFPLGSPSDATWVS